MVWAERFDLNRQRLLVHLHRLAELALVLEHDCHVVIRRSNIGVVWAERFDLQAEFDGAEVERKLKLLEVVPEQALESLDAVNVFRLRHLRHELLEHGGIVTVTVTASSSSTHHSSRHGESRSRSSILAATVALEPLKNLRKNS